MSDTFLPTSSTASTSPSGFYRRFGKRGLDLAGGLVLVFLLAPVALIVASVVFLNLGWPILLRQRRVGERGGVFDMYKFRTMGADRRRSPDPNYHGPERRQTHKAQHDPRHTRVGRFLRKWSLDELPQAVHVVSGKMSLVGPRPELEDVVARYKPWQHRRHVVKPGLTGIWQVTQRGSVPLHEATAIELEYVANVSLKTDVVLLARTVPALVARRGN